MGPKTDKSLNGLRFPHTQTYFDKSFSIRLLIGFVFAFFLFLFLHFRQTYVDSFDLGSVASRYVVAQVDFAFPDDEATVLFKQEATKSIGTILRLDEDSVHHQVTQFQKYINDNEERLVEIVEKTGFRNLAPPLSLLTTALLQTRFTDARTLQSISTIPSDELPIALSSFYVFVPPDYGLESPLPLPFWLSLEKTIFAEEDLPQEVSAFIFDFFEKADWKFEVDQGTQYSLKKLIQARVPIKYTHVMAGERIIDQGEKVTARHLAMLHAMKEKLDEKRNLKDPAIVAGSVLMTILFLFVAIIYLKENHREVFYSNRYLALLATIVLLNFFLAKITEVFFIKGKLNLIDLIRFPLFVPFAAILLSILVNLRIAAFATLFLSIVFTIVMPVESISFLVINVITATVAILSMRKIKRRKEIFIVCAKAWLGGAIVILAFNLYENTLNFSPIFTDFSSTFIFMALTAILVVGLLPILESLFQIMTDISLMEFMDPSNEFLSRLMREAPGTFQHSLVVGSLAEAAASAIGANGLFCRVATEYHDIGKLVNPEYFTENQLGGIDMHQLLTPLESTQVIIGHVSEGVALARKIGLPEPFIDIIKEHHGTQLVYYFYHKQIELIGGDKSKVNEKDFRYSGPKPKTKESTIIMIADTLEAASRSLDNFNEATVRDLVDCLVAQKSEDGQFDESPLTFEEMKIVKRTLVKNLLAASHPRIKYPPHNPGEEG